MHCHCPVRFENSSMERYYLAIHASFIAICFVFLSVNLNCTLPIDSVHLAVAPKTNEPTNGSSTWPCTSQHSDKHNKLKTNASNAPSQRRSTAIVYPLAIAAELRAPCSFRARREREISHRFITTCTYQRNFIAIFHGIYQFHVNKRRSLVALEMLWFYKLKNYVAHVVIVQLMPDMSGLTSSVIIMCWQKKIWEE